MIEGPLRPISFDSFGIKGLLHPNYKIKTLFWYVFMQMVFVLFAKVLGDSAFLPPHNTKGNEWNFVGGFCCLLKFKRFKSKMSVSV